MKTVAKRLFPALCSGILLFSIAMSVFAAETAMLNGEGSLAYGKEMVWTLSVKDCDKIHSAGITVKTSDDIQLIKGKWLKRGSLSDFDLKKKKGVILFANETNVNGELFQLTFKARKNVKSTQTIQVTVFAKDKNNKDVFSLTTSKSILLEGTDTESMVTTSLKPSVTGTVTEESVLPVTSEQGNEISSSEQGQDLVNSTASSEVSTKKKSPDEKKNFPWVSISIGSVVFVVAVCAFFLFRKKFNG